MWQSGATFFTSPRLRGEGVKRYALTTITRSTCYRTFFCIQSSSSRAISKLFFSIITMWPLPRMPLSCRRMCSVLTPAC
jgi:hypothetical protein